MRILGKHTSTPGRADSRDGTTRVSASQLSAATGMDAHTASGCAAVARQPIFDSELAVVGYELLYRTAGADFAVIECAVSATAAVMVTAALDIGITKLVGSAPAFINFPRELLSEELPSPADPRQIVVEVLEDVEPDGQLLKVLATLRQRGYRVALDDFDPTSSKEALLDCADFVKVDVLACAPARLASLVAYLRRWRLQLIAEKIESEQQLIRCRELGFDAFQGYYLRRPETFCARRAPGNWIATLRLLSRLQDPEVSVEDLEANIACDVGLCYRLLRCVNSSYFGLGKSIESIGRAIVVLGLDELRAMCVAILLAGIDDRPEYLAKQAMIRASMCERLCVAAELSERQSYFMAGLLSVSDVLLGVSLEELLESMPLVASVREALLHGTGPMGEALACTIAYENTAWDRVHFRGLPSTVIATAYADGVQWTETLWTRVAASQS